MLANNKFEPSKQQIQTGFSFPNGSKIIALYGGRTCVISSPDQKLGGTMIGSIEQPQICHLCQKEFPSLLSLQNHIKELHLDNKIYRNIIAVSTIGNQVTMIPQQYQMVNTVKIEKDYSIPEVIKPHEYTTVGNLNVQQVQIQPRDKSNLVQVIKQNPVEYHIQQQEHAAQVVASMTQKSGVITNPFFNSTIKYEPIQLVTEVYPQMIAEAPKSPIDLNSQSPVSSPGSSVNVQTITTTTSGPMLSNGETMEKQHKCLVCDKFFTTVGNLNIHLKIHAGYLN
jgi:Zinc finger, C2H2 type